MLLYLKFTKRHERPDEPKQRANNIKSSTAGRGQQTQKEERIAQLVGLISFSSLFSAVGAI